MDARRQKKIEKHKRAIARLRKPGPLYVFCEGQEMSKMRYKVVLPAPNTSDDDISHRLLTATIDDGAPESTQLLSTAIETKVRAPRGARVRLEFSDVDLGGLPSEKSLYEFVAEDTIAPAKPGELSAIAEGQDPDDAPTFDPTPVV